LSAQRGGERIVLAPSGGAAQGATNAQGGSAAQGATNAQGAVAAQGATNAQGGSITQGGAGTAVVATAPTTGKDVAGPTAGAAGGGIGTDAQSTAPTAGPVTAAGTAPGEVKSETGVGSGGQAATEGGGNGEGQRGSGRGPGNIAITTPQNGFTLSPDDAPIVVVRGNVDDPEINRIWLTANNRRIEVRVRDGKFYYPLVVVDPTTKISAELPTSAGRRTETITVHAAPNAPTTGVVVIDWGEEKPIGTVDMGVTWRARADRLDSQNMKLFAKTAKLPDDIPVSAFYLRNLQAGVYTFMLSYKGLGGGTPFTPRFFLTSPGVPTARDMKPVTLAGSGSMAAVRVLLPHAVLWDQDEWFTGRSEASDSITKFRDDGTTWIERKGR